MKQKQQQPQGRRARRSFTPEFKADAVRLVQSGKAIAQVARELDLTETALREWVRRAEADAGARQDVLCVRGAREAARVELRTRVRESSAVEGDAALGIPTDVRATALLDVVLPGAWDVSCERAPRTPRTRTT